MKKRSLQELTISSAFMFGAVMIDPELCKDFLERALGISIARVEAIAKRARYYHAQIDMETLLSGIYYDELPDTYVIFVCDFERTQTRQYGRSGFRLYGSSA